jgi:hypothetical protein
MKNILVLLFICCLTSIAAAQQTAINTTGASADASAILDISSNTQGLLIPRMTDVQRTAIATPATGLLVYQTTAPQGFYYYSGTVWEALNGNLHYLTGNTPTAAITVGTTNNAQPLIFFSNNTERGRLKSSDGKFVWGATDSPYSGEMFNGISTATFTRGLAAYTAHNGSAVRGEVLSGTTSYSATQGVYGGSGTGSGVSGNYNGTNTSNTRAGVYGVVNSPAAATAGAGVYGFNAIASGNQHIGVLGAYNGAAFGIGVQGIGLGGGLTTGNIDVAVVGWRANNADYSGYYNGNHVIANGTKSASVPTSKGNQLFYCVESPEVWFEDLGTAQLKNGEVEVQLDPLFLETVLIDDAHPMHVFVQMQGECNKVYVQPNKTSFVVKEKNGGTSNVKFSYRIMAKRLHFPDHRFGSDATWGEGDTRKYSQVAPKKPIDYKEALKQQQEMDKNWKPIPNPAVTYPQEVIEGANNRNGQKKE